MYIPLIDKCHHFPTHHNIWPWIWLWLLLDINYCLSCWEFKQQQNRFLLSATTPKIFFRLYKCPHCSDNNTTKIYRCSYFHLVFIKSIKWIGAWVPQRLFCIHNCFFLGGGATKYISNTIFITFCYLMCSYFLTYI